MKNRFLDRHLLWSNSQSTLLKNRMGISPTVNPSNCIRLIHTSEILTVVQEDVSCTTINVAAAAIFSLVDLHTLHGHTIDSLIVADRQGFHPMHPFLCSEIRTRTRLYRVYFLMNQNKPIGTVYWLMKLTSYTAADDWEMSRIVIVVTPACTAFSGTNWKTKSMYTVFYALATITFARTFCTGPLQTSLDHHERVHNTFWRVLTKRLYVSARANY